MPSCQSVGGRNPELEGYHETITRVFLAAVRDHAAETPGLELCDRVNALLLSPRGRRDWPLRTYSTDRLLSIDARIRFVEPDL